MSVRIGALLVAVMGSTAGCGFTLANGFSRTAVVVHNKTPQNIDVYVWDASDRATRLGYLAAGDTADFGLPKAVTSAGGPYYLEARVPGGTGDHYPTYSEPFTLRKGERITWLIPALTRVVRRTVPVEVADSGNIVPDSNHTMAPKP